jgi:hypothetical protein
MNTAEIVVREVQGNSGFQVRPFLAESIRQARRSPARHSHRQVLPLHKRSAEMVRVGSPRVILVGSESAQQLKDIRYFLPLSIKVAHSICHV